MQILKPRLSYPTLLRNLKFVIWWGVKKYCLLYLVDRCSDEMAAWFSWRESLVDYHHLQEIKEARPIKSKIVSEQWMMGRWKCQLLFFFSFPFPSSPVRILFPLSPASLRHQKASGSLWGGQKFHRLRLTEAQAQREPRRAQWNEPTVCRCQSKDSTFSHIHGWTKTSLTKKSIGSITWFTEKSWQFTL